MTELFKLQVCFWCGNLTVEAAALLGSARNRRYTPVVSSYVPCPGCQGYMRGKVLCFEVRHVSLFTDSRPPLSANHPPFDIVAPTGRWLTVSREEFGLLPISRERETLCAMADHGRVPFEMEPFNKLFSDKLNNLRPELKEAHFA